MDQNKVIEIIDSISSDSTEHLVALYKNNGPGHPEEFFEAIRRTLVVRGAINPPRSSSEQGLGGVGFSIIGAVIGGFVGCLVGKPPLVSFEDVLTRGSNLTGFSILLRPAAESAFNWMLAGIVLGAVAGFAVVYLKSHQSVPQPAPANSSVPIPLSSEGNCVHCGAIVPTGMQFCGMCGKPTTGTTCGKCGKTVPPDQTFCGGCGAKVL